MIYSNSGAEFLQIRGKEKPILYSSTIGFSSFGFEYNNNTFPICTSDYILFALYPECIDNDYTKQYQYLLLAPPVNSYAIKQKEFDQYSMHEFLLHFDDKYVVRMKKDYYKVQFDVCLLSGNVMQTVEIVTNNQVTPVISANGEYIVIPTMIPPNEQEMPYRVPDPNVTDGSANATANIVEYSSYYYNLQVNAPTFKVYKIKRTDEYKKKLLGSSNLENKEIDRSDLKNVIILEMIKKYDVSHQLLKPGYSGEDYTIFSSLSYPNENINNNYIDNKGNVWYINPDRKCLLYNNVNLWTEFTSIIEPKLGTFETLKFVKFGQDNIIVNKDEVILNIKFDSIKLKFSSVKELKHKIINIKGCTLERIIAPRDPNCILLFYRIEKSMTIVAWDLEKDIEHSNFSSKGNSVFMDYMEGKHSMLGYACFSLYIVNLDIGIPIPFISKSKGSIPVNWSQGLRINAAEDVVVNCGDIITPVCQRDIYYQKYPSFENLDYHKFIYYLDKKSVVFDYLDNPEKLQEILSTFDK